MRVLVKGMEMKAEVYRYFSVLRILDISRILGLKRASGL